MSLRQIAIVNDILPLHAIGWNMEDSGMQTQAATFKKVTA